MSRATLGVVLIEIAALGAFLPAPAAWAGAPLSQQERERLRERILNRVDEYLDERFEELRAEIRRILDEELSRRFDRERPREHVEMPQEERPPEPPRRARPSRPGYLGVLPSEFDGAVTIEEVLPGTPAERAGLRAGDVILAVGGDEVDSVDVLRQRLLRAGAGREVTLRIARGDEELDVRVTLAEYPREAGEPQIEPPEREEEARAQERLRERIRRWIEERRRAGGERREETQEEQSEETEEAEEGMEDLDSLVDSVLGNPSVQEMLDRAEEMLREMGFELGLWLERDEHGQWRMTETARDYLRQMLEMAPTPGEGMEDLRQRLEEMRGRLEEMLRRFEQDRPEPRSEPAPQRPSERPRGEQRGAFLGVAVTEPDDEFRAEHDLEEGVGVLVTRVAEGSPAARAGIRPGDVLLSVDGQPIRGERGLARRLARAAPGDEVRVVLLRDGRERTVTVRVGEHRR